MKAVNGAVPTDLKYALARQVQDLSEQIWVLFRNDFKISMQNKMSWDSFFCCYCLFLINVQRWMYPPKPNRAPSKASSIVTDNYTVPLSLSMLFKWSQNPKCLLAGLHVMLKKKKRIIAAILRSWLALVPTVFKPCDQKKQIWHELGQRLHQQLLFYLSRMASAWVWGKTLGRLRKIEPHYHSGLRECAGSFAAVKMHSPV